MKGCVWWREVIGFVQETARERIKREEKAEESI